ncbi:MAG: LysE family translocator [Pseudomonadota bacterium]
MELSHLLAFNAALLVAIASPGPSLLFLLRNTLSGGRRTGLITACGLGVMATLWTVMAVLGLDVVFRLFPWAYLLLKTAGALYLCYLAFKIWQNARAAVADVSAPDTRNAFLAGVLVNLANPKSVFFSASVLVVIFPATLTFGEKALIVANHLAIELTVQPLLALAFSTGIVTRGYLRAKITLDRTAAAVLGALGIRLLLDRS